MGTVCQDDAAPECSLQVPGSGFRVPMSILGENLNEVVRISYALSDADRATGFSDDMGRSAPVRSNAWIPVISSTLKLISSDLLMLSPYTQQMFVDTSPQLRADGVRTPAAGLY